MTVAELIEELLLHDPSLEVYFWSPEDVSVVDSVGVEDLWPSNRTVVMLRDY
jgi:hypothetical protein